MLKCQKMSKNVEISKNVKMSKNVGCRKMSKDVERCQKMSKNVNDERCREMSKDVERCRKMSKNVEKCRHCRKMLKMSKNVDHRSGGTYQKSFPLGVGSKWGYHQNSFACLFFIELCSN